MKARPLPYPATIDSIISEYNIQGEAKNSLLAVKELICDRFGKNVGICVQMDLEAFKAFQNGLKELKDLKEQK